VPKEFIINPDKPYKEHKGRDVLNLIEKQTGKELAHSIKDLTEGDKFEDIEGDQVVWKKVIEKEETIDGYTIMRVEVLASE
jgi:hypothetical protein